MGAAQTVLQRLQHNMLKWFGHVLRTGEREKNIDLVAGRKKKKTKTRNEVKK
jgi:hypothetical protein